MKSKPSDKSLFINLPYFIKGHLRMSASDEATLKKNFGRSKPSSKLTLKTKWYHSCRCCDDCQSKGCDSNEFQLTFTCLKPTIETLNRAVKYVQS